MTAEASNQLHRELLRWIQSLDLAYSIKNVKRDFANGFLVAEILSRYYDKDISMHSYDNGIGVKVKKDNWDQLLRVFSRVVELEPLANRADVDAVIHCQNGAAVALLTKLYQCLTKRTIQPTVAPSAAKTKEPSPPPEEIPPYAKPTGTAVIRDKMRDADLAELRDETEVSRRVRSIHSQHEEQLQLDRLLAMDTPERYPSLRSASKATVLRGATKPVRNDEAPVVMTQHVVKEVQIKSMNEKSLEKLRQNREAKESEAHSSSPSAVVSFDHYPRGNAAVGAGELVQRRRPMDLLSEAVSRKLTPAVLTTIDAQRGRDKFDAFVDALHVCSEPDAAAMFTDVVDDPLVLAQAFLDFPREFWKFAGLTMPFLADCDDESALFAAVHDALLRLGRQSVKRDAAAATLLLTDYLLPKITAMLGAHATKRAPLLQLVYAFTSETPLAHVQVIKRLREALPDDIPLFVHALSILLDMERELDDTLVDLYHYYCCIGLETPCEKLRAASLSMLVPFLRYDLSLVADLLPRLTQFSSRHAWWEVKTQLLVVASAFLHAASASDLTDQIELALTLIEREFHPTASLNVRRVGLSYLAKNLSQYQVLVPLFVDVLLSIPLALRSAILDAETAPRLPVRGTSGAVYELRALAPQWDGVAVAKQLFYERKSRGHADVDALQVLQACFAHASPADAAALFDQMRGFVVLGLADPAACGVAAALLLGVAARGGAVGDVVGDDAFLRVLLPLATRNVEDIRQQTAVRLLHDLHALDAAAVARCVASVAAQTDAAAFRGSLFSISFEG